VRTAVRYRGVVYTEKEIGEVRSLIALHGDKSRYFLSKELCRLWQWTQANGTPKDMVCRGLFLVLDRQGLIRLPPQKRALTWLSQKRLPARVTVDTSPVETSLESLLPLSLRMVRGTDEEYLYTGLIRGHHYLGYTRPVGEHLEYVAFIGERPIACIGFCSAPRHIGCRDRHLGWTKDQRIANLHKIVVNTRFLILPWVRVPHLASHLLGRVARELARDWQRIYAHEIVWLETFVDPARGFTGTCYKAANWRYLGLTTGRGKSDHTRKANRSLKVVFGYPLRRGYREALHVL
jgi:hypothetical protein